MKKLFVLIVLVIFILIVCLFFKDNNIINNRLISVSLNKCVDGDTAWFLYKKVVKKYRFLAIDTMELDTEYGLKTNEYVCNILNDAKSIQIAYDTVGNTQDKYGRELVWIYVNGELLQDRLVSEGYASLKYIYANYEYLDILKEKENNAKEEKLGIWNSYTNKVYNESYKVKFKFNSDLDEVSVLKNDTIDLIDNPKKDGCKFIGWLNGDYLFDFSRKINKDYSLEAHFEC